MKNLLLILLTALLAACGRPPVERAKEAPRPAAPDTRPLPPDTRPVIAAFGDSLTAGHGVEAGESYPDFLQKDLDGRGLRYRVVNAGLSGDTTSGGLARLDGVVTLKPEVVILELGANDALRGIDPAITRRNLEAIIAKLKERNIPILLTGMIAPPNMGSTYGAAFNPIFPELAAKHGLIFDPFFLEGVAAERDLNLADGMHPNGRGVDVIVRRILPKVEELIAQVRSRRGG